MSRRTAAVAVLCMSTVLLTGCVNTAFESAPACESPEGEADRRVVLMAQAVPTATSLPCVRGLPVGWEMGGVDVEDGLGRFWLSSDRDGPRAVRIDVTERCDTDGATEVPSDQPGMRRYERIDRVEDGYGGERHYVYPGGCTTYVFDLHGETMAQPLAAVAAALGFVNRGALREQVREETDGRLELDAETT